MCEDHRCIEDVCAVFLGNDAERQLRISASSSTSRSGTIRGDVYFVLTYLTIGADTGLLIQYDGMEEEIEIQLTVYRPTVFRRILKDLQRSCRAISIAHSIRHPIVDGFGDMIARMY